MSLDSVRAFFAREAPEIAVIVTPEPSATVVQAAAAHCVAPAQIAKTLALELGERVVLIVARGDARLDNRKLKDTFGAKGKMLPPDEVAALTGHPVGGVCPFGLARPLDVYCDVTLRAFDEVIPAAGAIDAAVRIAPERMASLTGATWVDVCREGEG